MSEKNELSTFIFLVEKQNINYNLPSTNKITNKLKTEIENAYKKSCGIDISGHLWFSNEKLHSILRIIKKEANYYVTSIDKEDKCLVGDITFIRGSKIIEIIDKRIQDTGDIGTSNNLRYAWDLYSNIRDCSDVQMIRVEYNQKLDTRVIQLKKKRIKKFKIQYDELTGDKLDIKTSEFSHIRGSSVYPDMSDNILNGLIVNKGTHTIITEEGIQEEEELLKLYNNNKWKTDWYEEYISFLKN